ncbi:hypothetical protein B0T22DRAFT_461467 [Podospora appendiculata]|uniref:Uncharacterized protein n=1 Tax=Podospora appendiculata TaxID=314037 RepID=A0AAE0XBA0_9PEZI|nr:hypothetical protein B0T22DRAFT_461467 [Podospora appendiculata]
MDSHYGQIGHERGPGNSSPAVIPPILETSAYAHVLLDRVHESSDYHPPPDPYPLDRQDNVHDEAVDLNEPATAACSQDFDNSPLSLRPQPISLSVAGTPDHEYQGQSGVYRSAQDSADLTCSAGVRYYPQSLNIQPTDDGRGNGMSSSADHERDCGTGRKCKRSHIPTEDSDHSSVTHRWSSCMACNAKKNSIRDHIVHQVLTNAMPRILEILQRELEQLDDSSTLDHKPLYQDADSDTSFSAEILPMELETISARL